MTKPILDVSQIIADLESERDKISIQTSRGQYWFMPHELADVFCRYQAYSASRLKGKPSIKIAPVTRM